MDSTFCVFIPVNRGMINIVPNVLLGINKIEKNEFVGSSDRVITLTWNNFNSKQIVLINI